MKDLQGREYAKLSDLKAGDVIEIDGDFTCAKAGRHILKYHTKGLYFDCDRGTHFIDGQLSGDVEDYLIGIYGPVKEA
jgi:hypothetical protein